MVFIFLFQLWFKFLRQLRKNYQKLTSYSKAMITYSPKSVVQKQNNSLKNILRVLTTWRRETKNLGDMIHFIRGILTNQKSKRTKTENQLICHSSWLWCTKERKEHLDTLTNYISRHETFKGSLGYNLKVLLPEALIKLAQVTLKYNRLEAKFYLNDVVSHTECNKSFQRDQCQNLVSLGMYYLDGKNFWQ